MPIATLDLHDLHKVNPTKLSPGTRSACEYTAPCVVGAMMTEEERKAIAEAGQDNVEIRGIINDGCVAVPAGQEDDFDLLQRAFDAGSVWSHEKYRGVDFAEVYDTLVKKYPPKP